MNDPTKFKKNSGKDVAKVIDGMSQILIAQDPNIIVQACLTLAIVQYHPNIKPDNLIKSVREASEFIAMMGDEIGMAN